MSVNLMLTLPVFSMRFSMLMPKVMFDPLGPESGMALIETNIGDRALTATLPDPQIQSPISGLPVAVTLFSSSPNTDPSILALRWIDVDDPRLRAEFEILFQIIVLDPLVFT
ncbi:Uncharacterised protein [uncultured archaeon]|nr:Uncharacterised protein [uncultured archaeon]